LGRDALDSMQTAALLVNNLPGRIAKEQDAALKEDLQNQLDQARETIETAPEEAKRYFRLALALADDQTDPPRPEHRPLLPLLPVLHERRLPGSGVDRRVPGSPVSGQFGSPPERQDRHGGLSETVRGERRRTTGNSRPTT
jgi:hypothetical protein